MKKRGLSVLLLFCMLLTMVPTVAVAAEEGPAPDIPTGAIYVSQDGVADGDGQSAQSALKFDEAMANAKDGNVFVVVGTVEMENWTTPEKDITICGANENAVLKFAGYYGKENVWLSLQGDLTVENLTLAFSKQQYEWRSVASYFYFCKRPYASPDRVLCDRYTRMEKLPQ